MPNPTTPAFLVVALTATPALAQSAPDAFTGPRVEATIGFDQLRFDLGDIGSAGRTREADLGYGGAVGYDLALTPTLIGGFEVAVNRSDLEVRAGDSIDGGSLRKRREITVGGRIGTAIASNALIYGKVGYANLQLRRELVVGGVAGGGKDELDGIQLGAGAEVAISAGAYLKGEYRYSDYQDGYFGNVVVTGIGFRF